MSVNIQTSSGLVKIAGTPTIDTDLSNVSKNPVQNKVVTEKFDEINNNLNQQSTEAMDLKMLGWSIPKECPVQNYVDSDGVFHQRVERVDLGDLEWGDSQNGFFYSEPISNAKTPETNWSIMPNYSNKYECVAFQAVYNNSVDDAFAIHSERTIWLRDTTYTDTTAFKTAMKGVYLYYELATPITMTIDGNEAVTKVNDSLSQLEIDLKMLGYTVPKEMPVQNYVDADGVFHQRVGRVDLGSLSWNRFAQNETVYLFNANFTYGKSDKNANGVCRKYSTFDTNNGWVNMPNNSIGYTTTRIRVRDDSYTDATAFKNAMKGVYLYYELAEEKTIAVGSEAVAALKSDLDKYKPKEYYGKSLTMPTDGSYLVTASAMGYSVMVCTYAVYVLDGAIRYIEQVASKDLTLSFSGNVITPSYTANNIYFYVLQIGNIWS